jgi:hypothetical protein
LASVAAVSATKTISGKNSVAKLLRNARRVEEAAADDAANQEDDYSYIAKYSIKLIGCKAGYQVANGDNGEIDYNAAVFRLCPTDSGCSSDTAMGCSAGYGDYIVGLNTFVDSYFEDQRDNMNWDDQFDGDKYAECAEYEVENDGDNNGDDQVQYWVGPTCTTDGMDVRLAVFSEETCTTESSTSFETISNGWSLPFSSGGLVSTSCIDCLEYDDNGNYDLRDMCLDTYQGAGSACETKMDYYSYYGQNVQGCDTITALLPAEKKSGGGGKVFGWILFIALIAGLAGYIVWWRKKKAGASDGLTN